MRKGVKNDVEKNTISISYKTGFPTKSVRFLYTEYSSMFPPPSTTLPFAVLVAWLAPVVNCIQLLPQVYKTWTTRRVHDLSLHSLLLLLLTSILWLLHGYCIADVPLMAAGLFTVTVNIVMVTLYGMYS